MQVVLSELDAVTNEDLGLYCFSLNLGAETHDEDEFCKTLQRIFTKSNNMSNVGTATS